MAARPMIDAVLAGPAGAALEAGELRDQLGMVQEIAALAVQQGQKI
jgi:hypothetical protein